MNIAIIGAGNVGGALGRRWARAGHTVFYAVRDQQTEKIKKLLAHTGHGAVAIGVGDTAKADLVALATPWDAVPAVLAEAGNLAGKIVVDCTNPLKFRPGTGLELALGFNDSGGETVARLAAGARVVKAFNTYGWENFADARYPNTAGLNPLMFLAGDEAEAKDTVGRLAVELGFEPFDAGGLRASREIEPLALIWIRRSLSGAREPNFTWARLQR